MQRCPRHKEIAFDSPARAALPGQSQFSGAGLSPSNRTEGTPRTDRDSNAGQTFHRLPSPLPALV